MPAKKKSAETTEIKVTSKATVQIGNGAWYSFESSKNREMTGYDDKEVDEEQDKLWKDVNGQIDKQIQDILDANKKE